jgi:hypothetical protein
VCPGRHSQLAAALLPGGETELAGHVWQALAEAVGEYVPAAQARQTEAPLLTEYVPVEHSEHVPPLPFAPAAQGMQTGVFAPEDVPAAQTRQTEAFAPEYAPAGQARQMDALAPEYVPAAQMAQADAFAPEDVPAAQARQTEAFAPEYAPAGQARQRVRMVQSRRWKRGRGVD